MGQIQFGKWGVGLEFDRNMEGCTSLKGFFDTGMKDTFGTSLESAKGNCEVGLIFASLVCLLSFAVNDDSFALDNFDPI